MTLSDFSDLITGFAALVGAFVALRGVNTWRVQIIGKRKIDIAENCFIAAMDLHGLLLKCSSLAYSEADIAEADKLYLANADDQTRKRAAQAAVAVYKMDRISPLIEECFEKMKLSAVYFGEEGEQIFFGFKDLYLELSLAIGFVFDQKINREARYDQKFFRDMESLTMMAHIQNDPNRKKLEDLLSRSKKLFGREIGRPSRFWQLRKI
jgi:hypothetical protein